MNHYKKFQISSLAICIAFMASCKSMNNSETKENDTRSLSTTSTSSTSANEPAAMDTKTQEQKTALGTTKEIKDDPAMPVVTDPKEILSRLHHDSEMEIKMGKLAQEKGSAKSIKEFGKALVEDHTAADKKVKDLAKKLNITLSEPSALTTAEKQKMSEHKKAGDELKTAKGIEFDQKFINAMKLDHEKAVAMLEQSNAENEDVKKLVSELLPTLRNHHRTSLLIAQQLNFK